MKRSTARRGALAIMFATIVLSFRLVIGSDAPPIRFAGKLTFDDHQHVLEHAFTVPKGVARIDVTLELTGRERRTTVDLGLEDAGLWLALLGGRP